MVFFDQQPKRQQPTKYENKYFLYNLLIISTIQLKFKFGELLTQVLLVGDSTMALIGFVKIILKPSTKMNTLENHTQVISELCKSHKVKTLYAFGSVLTDKFNEDSDIDLIVDFQPFDVLEYSDNYFDLKFSLEDLLKRPIDLLEEKAIKNPYFKQTVNQQKQLVYGQ